MTVRRKILLMIIIGGVVAVSGAALLYKGHVRFNYPDTDKYPVRGIDVSHHQGVIDWKKVSEQDIRFVFIKATEGGDFIDPKFEINWHEAKAAGLDVGAYHFFTFCRPGIDQAKNFIKVVPKDSLALAPVIDLEFGGNCSLKKSKLEILDEIKVIIDRLDKHYGKAPILYVTQEFYDDFLINQFLDNPIWIRDIYNEPQLENNRPWLLWQFANRGHLEGIDMYVDLNVFNGTEEEYLEMVGD